MNILLIIKYSCAGTVLEVSQVSKNHSHLTELTYYYQYTLIIQSKVTDIIYILIKSSCNTVLSHPLICLLQFILIIKCGFREGSKGSMARPCISPTSENLRIYIKLYTIRNFCSIKHMKQFAICIL